MTLVERERPIRRPFVKCGGMIIQATDPPKYTREEIARKARALLSKLFDCGDCRPREARKFVRYMVECWGKEY
jgi:hypothetical protein